jgi:hypothetical protein
MLMMKTIHITKENKIDPPLLLDSNKLKFHNNDNLIIISCVSSYNLPIRLLNDFVQELIHRYVETAGRMFLYVEIVLLKTL